MGQRAKKAKVGASQTNYPFITERYVIPDFSPTGAKAGLKRAKIRGAATIVEFWLYFQRLGRANYGGDCGNCGGDCGETAAWVQVIVKQRFS